MIRFFGFIFLYVFFIFNNSFGSDYETPLNNIIYEYESKDSVSIIPLSDESIFIKSRSIDESQVATHNTWKWYKFNIENNQSIAQKKYLVVQNGLIQYLSFYIKKSNNKVQSIHTGIDYPFFQRPIDNRQFTFLIEIPSHQSVTVYLRGHINTGTLIMPLRLFSEKGYYKYLLLHNSMTMLTVSVWLFALIFGLVLYIIFREKLYFFYTAYVFLLMIFWASYETLTYEWLWPNSPYLANNSRNTYLLASAFFASFILSILSQSGNKLLIEKKIIKYLTIFFVPMTLLISFTASTMYNICGNLVMIADILLVSVIVLIIKTIVSKLIEKNEYSIFTLVSSFPMLFYVTVNILSYYAVIYIPRTGFFMQYGFGICSILEVLCLFWLLIYRFRLLVTQNILSQNTILASKSLISDYKQAVEVSNSTQKYQNSLASFENLAILIEEIEIKLSKDKIYKDPDLSLQKLAQLTNSSSHLISQAINQVKEVNFNDYINYFRVEEAKQMLKDDNIKNLSIEGIGEEVGFSTKTTFYAAFKKFAGTTPKKFATEEV